MPYGNRMGPDNMGPMTGRGAGFCTGNNTPGYMNQGGGFGRGRGGGRAQRGGGFGFRNQNFSSAPVPAPFYPHGATGSAVDEAEVLKDQETYLEKQLKAVKDRISSLDKGSDK